MAAHWHHQVRTGDARTHGLGKSLGPSSQPSPAEPQQRAAADQTSTPSITTRSTSLSRESIAQEVQETSQDVMSAGMSI